MGALVGLAFGTGALLIWHAVDPRSTSRPAPGRRRLSDLQQLLTQAGIDVISARQLVVLSALASLVAFVLAAAVSGSPVIAVVFTCFAAAAPTSAVRYRQRRRMVELRDLWPEVVDNIASGVRAGLSLPEALGEVGNRGPEQLRAPFRAFAADYRVSGRFAECLDRLKDNLADPIGDRIIESLRIAREVGGTDLGRLLRTLAAFLRDDARTRAELETRQGWTVNAARLALAAPWLMLALLSLNPQAAHAYNSATGVLVLLIGGVLSGVAYRLMVGIARLPADRRVLQ